ncbi:MAG TPA: mechanosensitive ion channel family protein [Ktedonobacterales bacterium]
MTLAELAWPSGAGVRAGLTLVVVAIALVASYWLGRLASRAPAEEQAEHTEGRAGRLREAARNGMGSWLSRATRISIWLAAVLAVAIIWLWGTGIFSRNANEALASALGDIAWKIGWSLLVVALALALGRRVQALAAHSLGLQVNRNLAVLGGRAIYIAILALGAIIILGVWGPGLVFPAALLGALAVALSLSLQDVLKNLVAGIYLLLEHPFLIGDSITISTYTGEVEDIQIRYTALHTVEGQRVLVPNGLLFSSPVVNHSFYDRKRAVLSVALPDTGPDGVDEASEAIQTALAGLTGLEDKQEPQVVLSGTAAGKMDLRVVFWLPAGNPTETAHVISRAIERVRGALPDAEVSATEPAGAAV